MKHIKKLVAIVLVMFAITACAQKVTFPSLANKQGITNIYVSKAMINMMGTNGNLPGNIPDEVMKNLDSIEVITSEESPGCNTIKEAFKTYIAENPGLELLMNVNDDGESVTIYGLQKADSENYSKIIMNISDSDGEVVLIVMTGNITSSDLENMDF